MTETLQSSSTEEMIDEIRAIIDRGLGDTKSRQVIAASEVADLLLDLRLVLDSGETQLESVSQNRQIGHLVRGKNFLTTRLSPNPTIAPAITSLAW